MADPELRFQEAKQKPETILVPGGTGQIGSEIVKMFLEQGAKVIIPSRSGKYVSLTKKLLKKYSDSVFLIKCNYCNDGETRNLVNCIEKKFDKIDALIYCAGMWSGHQ